MSQNFELAPEKRIAQALMEAAHASSESVDFGRALMQIPAAERPRVQALLTGMTEQTAQGMGDASLMTTPPRNIKNLVEDLRLEEGYIDAVETQRFFGLLKFGQSVPDFGTVTKTFTPEKLLVAQMFREPRLVLTTQGRSFNELCDAIDNSKTFRNQKNTRVFGACNNGADDKPEHWGAHIVDASRYPGIVSFHDDPKLSYGKRLNRFSRFKKANEINGMDRFRQTHLLMQDFKNGISPSMFATFLDDDAIHSAKKIPYVGWHDHFGRFLVYHDADIDQKGKFTCFRGSVGSVISGK